MPGLGKAVHSRIPGRGTGAFTVAAGPHLLQHRAFGGQVPQFLPEEVEFPVGDFRLPVVVRSLVLGDEPLQRGDTVFVFHGSHREQRPEL